ncbi:VOC family protein [Mucilaginibacter lappiensis]|uniref:PhnB protein n=1 Tax=Mucilaginibacter lappiensis TaxID=354630 RepID=A0A841JJX0_9SPHI|nr:VOC family protein [Mucilaginibacter lappiensis]MBB6129896.1 PhnB protein [Mucilaginibacter lappiensis]
MKKEKNIPEAYQRIMPYLIVKDAPAFIIFMQNVFGAKEQYKKMRDEKYIMHAELNIEGSTVMFCDSTETYLPRNAGLFIYVDNCDETYKKALENGAVSVTEPVDQTYGRSAGVKDPFGNTWWVTNPF